jgi:UDP-N-acetylglucosamine 2-epimerase
MEAGYLKKPFINVGNRQKGRERGVNVISTNYDCNQILKSISIALSEKFNKKIKMSPAVYLGGGVSDRIVEKIEYFLKNYYV